MTRFGLRNNFVFINFKLYMNGCYFCHQIAWYRISV